MSQREPVADWRARLRGSRWGTLVVLLITAFAVAIGAWVVMRPGSAAGAVSEVQVDGAAAAPMPGEPAPLFNATALDGSPVNLDDYAGRPVWLVFVATWCTGCRSEAPDVQAAHEQAGQDGIQVVSVYLGEDADTVSGYAERAGLTHTQVPDTSSRLSAAYGVRGVPAHYFIDADGIVRETRVGVLSTDQIGDSIAAVGG